MNDYIMQTVIWCAAGLALLAAVRLFFSPVKAVIKAILKTAGGFIWLAVINFAGSFAGVSLGFNLVNAAVIGLLGLPGAVLLLMSRWVLMM